MRPCSRFGLEQGRFRLDASFNDVSCVAFYRIAYYIASRLGPKAFKDCFSVAGSANSSAVSSADLIEGVLVRVIRFA